MFVLEKCYNGCGWAAYAYVNSWMSVYQVRIHVALACYAKAVVSHSDRTAIKWQSVYYKHVGVQVHELGKDLYGTCLFYRGDP